MSSPSSSISNEDKKPQGLEKNNVNYELGEVQSVISGGSDPAIDIAHKPHGELTPEMDKKILRKVDLYLLSFVSVLYGIQFADKLIPSSAAILNLNSDLFANSKTGYSWVGSSFYLGYLVFEFPMSYALQKFPLALFTSLMVVSWGIVLACTAACQTMESFLALRVLLGAFECVTQPALVILISQWYKRSEVFSRTCCWFAMNGFGGILVTSICYGLKVHYDVNPDVYGMSPWRVIYIIMGCITILVGVIFYFHIPDNPSKAWFLTEEEKVMQVERIRANNQGYGSHHIKKYQIWEALTDIRTWLYGISYLLSNVPNGGTTVFATLILEGEGYIGKDALLMNLPSSAVEFAGFLIMAFFSNFFFRGKKLLFTIFGSCLTVMCLCLLAWGPDAPTQLAGLYLYFFGGPLVSVGLISLVESDSLGHTKKVTSNAFLLVCYCIGNVAGPQAFLKDQAPIYNTGKVTMAATQCAELALVIFLLFLNIYENKRRDKLGVFEPPEDMEDAEFADLTDKEMLWYRYSY
ncbi:allantoate permease [Starmerella bacillaris]|uniref:Allantoate permease n=1 Tax=Starmerella bacillaris TaxID=1247836 RepID=A0AAV5RHP3_STABA|nr:allantoate permease [Starmerella bacillaris]